MQDYASNEFVPPYRNPEQTTAPDCSEFSPPYVCNDGNGNGYPFCGIPDASLFQYTENVFEVGSKYYNSYSASAGTGDYSACENSGEKRVFAKKAWSGKRSYNSRTLFATDKMDWCSNCQVHDYDATPDTTKYLALSAQAHISQTDVRYGGEEGTINGQVCCPGEACEDNACQTYTVQRTEVSTGNATSINHADKFGNLYVDAAISGGAATGFDDPEQEETLRTANAAEAWSLLEKANDDITDLISIWSDERTAIGRPPDSISPDSEGSSFRLEWYGTYNEAAHCDTDGVTKTYTTNAMEIDLAAGRVEVWKYDTHRTPLHSFCTGDGNFKEVYAARHDTWIYNGINMSYRSENHFRDLLLERTIIKTVECTLSSPYTSAQVLADMHTLLGYYPLDDDVLLPWKTNLDGIWPLVSYDETTSAPFAGATDSSIVVSGKVMGKPAPRGIDFVWNPEHPNRDFCVSSNELGPCYIKYVASWGASSLADAGIPHATQWLDKWTAHQMPQGAFVGNGFFETTPSTCNETGPQTIQDDTIWGCKRAEIIQPSRRSFNFARPCSVDRYSIEENSDRCIVDISGSVVTLEPTGEATNIATGDKVWICGTSYDGCYTVTKDSDFQITLTAQIASASWYSTGPISDCGQGIVGKLRWQSPLKPAVCGRIDIVSASATAPITISLMEPCHLNNFDTVTISGATGMTALNGSWNVHVLDGSTVVLVGSDGSGGGYNANTGQIYSPDGADWKWNDDQPKYDYVTREWNCNFRAAGEYARIISRNEDLPLEDNCAFDGGCSTQPEPIAPEATCVLTETTRCQAPNRCKPMVAFWSPNGENFAHNPNIQGAVNYGFGTPDIDSVYGGVHWNAIVVQTQDDPLWIAPPCPCEPNEDTGELGCNRDILEPPWSEDEGDCSGGYAHAPQVEARAEAVAGAPALAAGSFGCPECPPPAHTPNAHSDNEELAYAPTITYDPYFYLYALERSCVCNAGAFDEEYTADGVRCPS